MNFFAANTAVTTRAIVQLNSANMPAGQRCSFQANSGFFLGPLKFLVTPQKSLVVRPLSPDNTALSMSTLSAVVELFGNSGIRWALCGGMSIDLQLGKLTRAHSDLDITVDLEDRHKLMKLLESRNLACFKFKRAYNLFDGQRVVLQVKASAEDAVKERYLTISTNSSNLHPKIDVFFHRSTDSGIEVIDASSGRKKAHYLDMPLVKGACLVDGISVPLINPAVMLIFQRHKDCPLKTHNRERIREIIGDSEFELRMQNLRSEG